MSLPSFTLMALKSFSCMSVVLIRTACVALKFLEAGMAGEIGFENSALLFLGCVNLEKVVCATGQNRLDIIICTIDQRPVHHMAW